MKNHRHYWKNWADGCAECRCGITLDDYEKLHGIGGYPCPVCGGREYRKVTAQEQKARRCGPHLTVAQHNPGCLNERTS